MRKCIKILGCVLALSACTSIPEETNQETDFSSTEVTFEGMGGMLSVQTASSDWRLANVRIGEVDFRVKEDEGGTGYSETYGWLTVECADREIRMSVNENDGKERTFLLELEVDGKVSEISGVQAESEERTEDPLGDRPDGLWNDVIGLSDSYVFMSGDGGEVRLTTEHFWWITEIWLGEDRYTSTEEENSRCDEEQYFDKQIDWLRVRRDGNDVLLTLSSNSLEDLRKFRVVLCSGDYYAWIYGTQAGLAD